MPGPLRPHQVLPLWYRALEEEIGIAVATNDRRHLQGVLYEARQQSNDEKLQGFRLIMAPPPCDKEIWIIKIETSLEGVEFA